MRKHSYREMSKRRFSSYVLFYIKDPKDAKTIFKYLAPSNAHKKDVETIKQAYSAAEELINQINKGITPTLHNYSPYIKEITEALHNLKNPNLQTTLF